MSVATLKSPRADMSEAEWETRCNLAALYRILDKLRMTDLIYTHMSARVPGEPNHFLINRYGDLFGEVTASSLVKMDFDRNVIGAPAHFNDAGFTVAVIWAVLFGAVHIAWSTGSRFALGDVAAADAAFDQLWFRVYNLAAACGAFVAAAAVIVLARGPTPTARRWARAVAWLAGVLLVVRGGIGVMQLGWIIVDPTSHDPLLAWAADVYMLLGGVLFVVVAWRAPPR
jgi:hypothetical protein